MLASAQVSAQSRHCHKGKPCGHTCIARRKTCQVGMPKAAIATGSESGSTADHSCGVERWSVKTLEVSDEAKVDLKPVPASVESLRELPRPPEPERSTRAPGEEEVYRVTADLLGWTSESDGDLHLVLAQPGDQAETMIAEIPAPGCSEETPHRFVTDFENVRAAVLRALGPAPARYVRLADARHVVVDGVAFFDFRHHQRGVALNAIGLHPVLEIELGN